MRLYCIRRREIFKPFSYGTSRHKAGPVEYTLLQAHRQHADQNQQRPRDAQHVGYLGEYEHLQEEGQDDVQRAGHSHSAGPLFSEGLGHEHLSGQTQEADQHREAPLLQATRRRDRRQELVLLMLGDEDSGGQGEGPHGQVKHHDGEVHVFAFPHDDDVEGHAEGRSEGAQVTEHVVVLGERLQTNARS